MKYVVMESCVGTEEMACATICPVDSVYEIGGRALINEEECIECGLCVPECPVTAIVRVP